MFKLLAKIFGTAQERKVNKYRKVVAKINEWEEAFQKLSDTELRAKTKEFGERLERGEALQELLPEAYAVVKNACRRMYGQEVHVSGYNQKWDMVPYDVQLLGAIAIFEGAVVEMQTGEGKTITAVLPCYLHALTGKPVHLVTVNDYLANRDCQWVGAVLRWLGLTTGALTNATPPEERKRVYQCDVVYGTASEFGFDYLRDNSMVQRREDQVQRGRYFALVDEVDSILIDEARTPLIISGPVPSSRQMYDKLEPGVNHLVRKQRDLCNKIATEAKRVLEKYLSRDEARAKLTKKERAEFDEATKRLWLMSKGLPQSKTLRRLQENPDIRAAVDEWDLHYYADPNKEERHHTLAELYIIVDQKSNEFELTDLGIQEWSKDSKGEFSGDDFIMLDISEAYMAIDEDHSLNEEEKVNKRLALMDEDAHRKERAHNLRQLLRAHLLMERDVDYIVHDDQVVIIDENTGRPQPGRRFSDGLHQAIEAKEGVSIQKETQTYATITLQNYFRMYEWLSGMSGTVTTEAKEFKEVYDVDVLEIPTYKPCQRADLNDEVYMTEREKYAAILKEIEEVHSQGRPILIGTESVEVSEKLARILRQHQLRHTILNAKHHEQEAEIISQAGQEGAITVSTNMAGRGTDIKLGNGVAKKGGLHVVGTTRQPARRIDRQLRGRSARLGDPGSTKFFVSFEDSLMQHFKSPTLTNMLQRLRPPEGEPIQAKMLNRALETAQTRIEQRFSAMREHTLKYDDVMNRQREEIYRFRNDLLRTEDIYPIIDRLLRYVSVMGAEKFFSSRSEPGRWNPRGYREWLHAHIPVYFEEDAFDDELKEFEELGEIAAEKIIAAFHEKMEKLEVLLVEQIPEESDPATALSNALCNMLLHRLDQLWVEHLLAMDHLRTEVHLRAVGGQRDPLIEFKQEAFRLFDELGMVLRTTIARDLFRFQIVMREPEPVPSPISNMSQMHFEKEEVVSTQKEMLGGMTAMKSSSQEPPPKPQPITSSEPKVGRNDPCPCGSGKKYKKCCGHATVSTPSR